jgi:ketosteroid isomerase-like protein
MMRMRGRARTSGVPVHGHELRVWMVRDGKPRRLRVYAGRAEALKTVGLKG